jgi:DNA-binding LytR/AlgR family response regulator
MKKIFIVEDESIVAKDIQDSLIKLGYEVSGIANNSKDAYTKIIELNPDLILMDIMIKGDETGIDLSNKLKLSVNIPILFLTAYADEATLSKAKLSEPYAYIIKPFKEIDLLSSIEVAMHKHNKDKELKAERDFLYQLVENKSSNDSSLIFVKTGGRLVKVALNEILYVEALKDYVIINTVSSRYTIHSTMKDIEKKLGSADFVRVHRSFIARLDKIQSIDSQSVILENNKKTLPVGGSYKDDVLVKLNTL